MVFSPPPILPPRPPYRSGEDPDREGHLAQLNQDYSGSPWLTVLIYFSGFVAVFASSLAAVVLLVNLGGGIGRWGPYALILSTLVGTHLGLRLLRMHRRRPAKRR